VRWPRDNITNIGRSLKPSRPGFRNGRVSMLEHVNRIAEMTAYTVVTRPDGPGHHNSTKSGTLPDLHMKSDASAP
jgi:hypothetical protein